MRKDKRLKKPWYLCCYACRNPHPTTKVNGKKLCDRCLHTIQEMIDRSGGTVNKPWTFETAYRTLRMKYRKPKVRIAPGCFEMGKRR